jgi:CYTH domain-containing protein
MRDQAETEPQVAPREIERKYLVATLPDNIDSHPHSEILQGYLAIDANGSEVRLRRKGDQLFETIKSAGGLTRAEYEIELTPVQFQTLWPATEGRRVEKIRYDITHASGAKIELDIYKGDLAGLCTAEVEFASEAESHEFAVPSWFGKEVTADSRYKNKNLALYGLPPSDQS